MHHRTKFHQNQSNSCGDIAFSTFQMAVTRHLGFLKIWIVWQFMCSIGPVCVTMQNFVKIGQTVLEILQFFWFSRWRSSAILDLWGNFWDNPQWVLGGLYYWAKFVWNHFRHFDNKKFEHFACLAWKCLFTPLFGGVFGVKIGENIDFVHFSPMNAIIWNSHHTKQIAKNWFCGLCSGRQQNLRSQKRQGWEN